VHAAPVPGWSDVERPVIGMHLHGFAAVLSSSANLVIAAGYILVPFTVLRYLPLTKSVLVSGAFFFVTCAITHLSMAFGFEDSVWMVVNHVVQAFAVVWFVLGFWMLLREALHRGREKDREQADRRVG
jgi:hypothetical protein